MYKLQLPSESEIESFSSSSESLSPPSTKADDQFSQTLSESTSSCQHSESTSSGQQSNEGVSESPISNSSAIVPPPSPQPAPSLSQGVQFSLPTQYAPVHGDDGRRPAKRRRLSRKKSPHEKKNSGDGSEGKNIKKYIYIYIAFKCMHQPPKLKN